MYYVYVLSAVIVGEGQRYYFASSPDNPTMQIFKFSQVKKEYTIL